MPGKKQVYRLYRPGTNVAFADLIALQNEPVTTSKELAVYDSNPINLKAQRPLTDFEARPLLKATDLSATEFPALATIRKHSQAQLETLPAPTQRLVNPDEYPVYMTAALAELQAQLATVD